MAPQRKGPADRSVQIRMTTELRAALMTFAEVHDLTFSTVVRQASIEYLSRNDWPTSVRNQTQEDKLRRKRPKQPSVQSAPNRAGSLSVKDASEKIGVTIKTMYTWIAEGTIKSVPDEMPGRLRTPQRIPKSEVERVLNDGRPHRPGRPRKSATKPKKSGKS